MSLFHNGKRWIWSTWAGLIRLPRAGNRLWQHLAHRPRIIRPTSRRR